MVNAQAPFWHPQIGHRVPPVRVPAGAARFRAAPMIADAPRSGDIMLVTIVNDGWRTDPRVGTRRVARPTTGSGAGPSGTVYAGNVTVTATPASPRTVMWPSICSTSDRTIP